MRAWRPLFCNKRQACEPYPGRRTLDVVCWDKNYVQYTKRRGTSKMRSCRTDWGRCDRTVVDVHRIPRKCSRIVTGAVGMRIMCAVHCGCVGIYSASGDLSTPFWIWADVWVERVGRRAPAGGSSPRGPSKLRERESKTLSRCGGRNRG